MANRLTQAEERKLVKEAITFAEDNANDDDEFVEFVRQAFFTAHPDVPTPRARSAGARGVRGGGGRAAAGKQPANSIFHDPRFVRNARELIRKTKANKRIMGGTTVKGRQFPDCVAVGNDRRFGCTGTLIAPNVVVSAGHCQTLATRVFFGNDIDKPGRTIAVRDAFVHPKYDKPPRPDHNDLVVLVLDRKTTVTPRCIATTSQIDKAKEGRAVGFGNVDRNGSFGYGIKRQVDVPIASPSCSGKVGNKSDASFYGCAKSLEIVAGKQLLAMDSCTGDSGGPFYIAGPSNTWLLAGATSRASDDAFSTCGDGGIYVRIDKYRQWIEDTTKIKLPK